MSEPIYHVYANYCGARKLLFAGYASRVVKKLGLSRSIIRPGVFTGYVFEHAKDRWSNNLHYTLWSGPITITECVPSVISTEVVEYEGDIV